MKNKFILFAALTAVVITTACLHTNAENAETPTVNDQPATNNNQVLPSFKLMTADGKTVDVRSFAGKKVFINLWASWCPPCRAEIPSIEKLYKNAQNKNVVFIMLSLDNSFAAALRFAQAKKMQLPVYYPAENLPALFDVQGIPATFIFNEQGELIRQIVGGENYNTPEYKKLLHL